MTTLSNRLACAALLAACALFVPLSGNAQDARGAAPPTSIGTKIDDSVITTKVRAALMSNEDVKSLEIKVKTRKGRVMLSGYADNQTQIDRSIAVAEGIEGVKYVKNRLSLKKGKQTIGNKIDDSVITTKIKSALLGDPVMNSLDVSVTTRKGEVQLSGFVNNAVQLTRAVEIAGSVEGVNTVVNHMSIKK